MKPHFIIKDAEVSDVLLIQQMITELAEYEKLLPQMVATPELLTKHLFGNNPIAHVLIAYDNHIPIGFALYFYNFSTFIGKPGIYLEDLYIKEAYRGNGYGKALLQKIIEKAREEDCGRVEWSVLDWNTPAIDFYIKVGAIPMNEWTTFRIELI
ncbi:MAG: GNAT family N-acetyltransferase [Bacteroidetes bacterium]|nr:GNAT family N-acetyltransferase [Bacteroidota bacterium]